MLKKTGTIIVMAVVAVPLLAFFAINTGFAESMWSYIGEQAASIREQKNDVAIAAVGDTRITQNDLDLAMLMREQAYELQSKEIDGFQNMMPEQPTKKKVLDSLIENEILYQEAVKRGCSVSLDEAKKYLEDNKKIYDEISNGKLTPDNKDMTIDVCKVTEDFATGMGMTMEEYMEYFAPTVQKQLSIAKLKQLILQSAPADVRSNPQKAEEYFNKQKEEIKKNYNVKYNADD